MSAPSGKEVTVKQAENALEEMINQEDKLAPAEMLASLSKDGLVTLPAKPLKSAVPPSSTTSRQGKKGWKGKGKSTSVAPAAGSLKQASATISAMMRAKAPTPPPLDSVSTQQLESVSVASSRMEEALEEERQARAQLESVVEELSSSHNLLATQFARLQSEMEELKRESRSGQGQTPGGSVLASSVLPQRGTASGGQAGTDVASSSVSGEGSKLPPVVVARGGPRKRGGL
jgi:hypothetical protein